MLESQNSFAFDGGIIESPSYPTAKPEMADTHPYSRSTSSVVAELKAKGEDFEFYPTTDAQIATVSDDIALLGGIFELTANNTVSPTLLDVGAGDGRVLLSIRDTINEDRKSHKEPFKAYAIEKATTHIHSYVGKGITLLGTDFHETSLVSKRATIAFTNPPYSEFSFWLSRIIEELSFHILYCVIPRRWRTDDAIQDAMKRRGLKFSEVLAESDFESADRKARGKVDVVRFSFRDLSPEAIQDAKDRNEYNWTHYKEYRGPAIYTHSTCPFELFINNELGLKKNHSTTSQKFSEASEMARVKKSLSDENSSSFAIVKSEGVLKALITNYEADMEKVLEQYKLIGQLDGSMLAELGVDFSSIMEAVKAKLFGFRLVYWKLLFQHLSTLKERISVKHRKHMLETLNRTALDFTYRNAIYVVEWAVKMTNNLTEETLADVFKSLTSEESILRYYKSNEHVFSDRWRFGYHDSDHPARMSKRVLDYRFIYSGHSNFSKDTLSSGAQEFCDDLVVMFRLLGYSDIHLSKSYEEVDPGKPFSIKGTTPEGDNIELIQLKLFLNGNRHIRFNQAALLRLNVTVARILGWVRSKEEFESETDIVDVADSIWSVGDALKILPSQVPLLQHSVKH